MLIKKAVLIFLSAFIVAGCSAPVEKFEAENDNFLEGTREGEEVFRVLLMSDSYRTAQLRNLKSIQRADDASGDQYISSQLKPLDKIDEAVESTLSIGLFPDSGRIMTVRVIEPTYLLEIDKLISEDIQRWVFSFPEKKINPVSFTVKYRVVLKKKLSDEEIIREVQKKMIEEQ